MLTRMIRNPGIKAMREEKGSVECGVESGKCKVWGVKWQVETIKCKVWGVKRGVWSVKCGVWNVKWKV